MTAGKEYNGLEIAIIGMSCRFPGSDTPVEFWNNLAAGRSLLKTFTDEELRNTGVPEAVLHDPAYVKTMGVLHDKDCFDRGFFRYGQEEAAFMDPQIRIFHELCWKALEDAGYAAFIESQKIGIIASASSNETWKAYTYNRMGNTQNDPFYLNMLSSPHFISSLIAYKLNLKGPASFVDTACSSSLMAVHNACRTLLTRECDLMLAGGIAIKTQLQKGYFYKEGMVRSNDGQCRAFDAQANGTATGEGGGVVVLKRLKDAITDRDHIYAIIKGTAANNDGSRKVGFTAPSVQGQSECIRKAHKVANVTPATIGYVEAHGTATKLGDPIEIKALNEAFDASATHDNCAIGSVKTNMGHLDAAAGVAGLIKTALCLKYAQLPPSLNYTSPNPEINFKEGPFYVNTALQGWQQPEQHHRRAGVSSFGIGGTNVHAVLEEAPALEKEHADPGYQLLCLSAKTAHSLERYIQQLHTFVRNNTGIDVTNMAYTLQTGRKTFPYRKTMVFRQQEELITQLEQPANLRKAVPDNDEGPAIIFMFPGQGSQYVNMAKDLYLDLPFFKQQMDEGFSIMEKLTGISFRDILYPAEDNSALINNTRYTQPLIFLVEYCLARYILSLGIRYRQMIGHSIGEYVCACIDGVFGFEDALRLVIKRGELMSSLPGGAMMAVALSEAAAANHLTEGISIAAINSPHQVVLSGSFANIQTQQQHLDKQGVSYVTLHTSHAFHSEMMDPILDQFKAELEKTTFNIEAQPSFISNMTGKPVTIQEACSSQYWVHHLRGTVRFHQGIRTLQTMHPKPLMLEVGAGTTLMNLLKQDPAISEHAVVLNTVRHPRERDNDIHYLTHTIGRLWEEGVPINWHQLHRGKQRRRISLPTYCFEQVRFISEVSTPDLAFTRPMPQETSYTAPPVVETPDLIIDRPELSNQYIPPVSETEKKLVALFETFFGINSIGIGDNFIELGGDSLKAMALLKMIKEQFNLNIMLKDFFNCTDLREIAAIIEERQSPVTQNEKQFTTII
jgi:acyl transferase domain-containing protein/acyl carrier protein